MPKSEQPKSTNGLLLTKGVPAIKYRDTKITGSSIELVIGTELSHWKPCDEHPCCSAAWVRTSREAGVCPVPKHGYHYQVDRVLH